MNPASIAGCRAHIERLLQDHPELADDEDFRRDMIEGETNLDVTIERLGREAKQVKAEIAGLRDFHGEIAERISRKAKCEGAIREAIVGLLNAAGLPGLKLPSVSVSFATIAPSVVVTDKGALPPEFICTKTEPDRAAIRDALNAGQTVPGACLSNGGRALRIS